MKRHVNLAVFASLLGTAPLLAACGGSDDGPGTEGAPRLELAASPTALQVRRGESATLQVTLAPASARKELAVVHLSGLPEGIAAGDVVLQPGAGTTATLTLTAGIDAPTGGPHAVQVEATIGDARLTAPLELVVAGLPGDLDGGFGEGGVAAIADDRLRNGLISGLAAVEGGAFGVVSYAASASPSYLFKVGDDGALDPAFGTQGVVELGASGAADTNCTLAVSPSGERVVAACLARDSANRDQGLFLRCFDSAGLPDTGCGPAGALDVAIDLERTWGYEPLVAVDGQNRITVVAMSFGSSDGGQRIDGWRIASDGAPDASFGDAGHVALETQSRSLTRLLALADGGCLVTGRQAAAGGADGAVAIRLGDDGAPDARFGAQGFLALDRAVFDAAEAEDGSLFFAAGGGAVLATDATGAAASRFGGEGVVQLRDMQLRAATIVGDGSLLVAGVDSVAKRAVVHRLTREGVLDPAFAARAALPQGVAERLAFGPDGRLYAAIKEGSGGAPYLAIARAWP